MRPSFGTNLPQIVTHIWQKAFFKHTLMDYSIFYHISGMRPAHTVPVAARFCAELPDLCPLDHPFRRKMVQGAVRQGVFAVYETGTALSLKTKPVQRPANRRRTRGSSACGSNKSGCCPCKNRRMRNPHQSANRAANVRSSHFLRKGFPWPVTHIQAANRRNPAAAKTRGCIRQAPAKSSRSRQAAARVIPHPGHSIPSPHRSGQW